MKISKERMFYVAAVVVVASVIASSVIALMTTNTSAKEEKTPTSYNEKSLTYVLGEKDGKVAGFVKDVEIPLVRTDTAVNSLPKDIQQQLRDGVEFRSEEEMMRVMKEWCS